MHALQSQFSHEVAAATKFASVHTAKTAHGQKPPQGIQAFLNSELDYRLPKFGWDGSEGRFRAGGAWDRISFRHRMGLGSDFMDALMLGKREGVTSAVIAAPGREFAKLITPKDAAVIITFEKLEEYYSRARHVFPFPLAIGKLVPSSTLPPAIRDIVFERLI